MATSLPTQITPQSAAAPQTRAQAVWLAVVQVAALALTALALYWMPSPEPMYRALLTLFALSFLAIATVPAWRRSPVAGMLAGTALAFICWLAAEKTWQIDGPEELSFLATYVPMLAPIVAATAVVLAVWGACTRAGLTDRARLGVAALVAGMLLAAVGAFLFFALFRRLLEDWQLTAFFSAVVLYPAALWVGSVGLRPEGRGHFLPAGMVLLLGVSLFKGHHLLGAAVIGLALATLVSVWCLRLSAQVLERLLVGVAVLALALAPTQLKLVVQGLPIGATEPLLALGLFLWAMRWWKVRDTHSLPPLSHWAMVVAVALGVFAAGDHPQLSVLKEAAQTVLYLLVGVTLFRATLTTPARIRFAIIALLATTTLAVGLGVAQRVLLDRHYQPDPAKRLVFADSSARAEDEHASGHASKQMGYWDGAVFHPASRLRAYLSVQTPVYVCSTFGAWSEHGYYPSRTAYAGFLALVLPFALVLLATARRRPFMIAWLSLLLGGAAVSVLAGYVVPAILLGLLVTGISLGPRVARWVLVGVAAYLLFTALLPGFNRTEVVQQPYQRQISATEAHYRYNDQPALKKFWAEQQAALNLFRYHAVLGVGAGQYQAKIGQAYDGLGRMDAQRLEADAQSGYLLTAANSGLIGLAALLLLFGSYLACARQQMRAAVNHPWGPALLGALLALAAMCLVTNPWVRGTSLVIAALFALLANGATAALPARITIEEASSCD